MAKISPLAALLGIACTIATASPLMAQTSSMFILDASGSMWGRLPNKEMKIVAARETMSELVGSMPDTISAGLIAYGHRRKGDCSDIEIVQAIAPGGAKKIARQIGSIVPRGKTPISDALILAGETIADIEDPTTIVLVSDGIETCEGDPCAVAAALSKSKSNLAVHVIGFAVDQKTRLQLQCVAKKGNGSYFTADTISELKSALTTVTESIRNAEPITIEAPEAASTSLSINLDISGPGTIQLDLGDWTHMPQYWRVLNPETGEEIAKTTKDKIEVLPGDYQIAWRHLEHGSEEVTLPQIISVQSGRVSPALIKTGLQLVPPVGVDKPYYWQLLPQGMDLEKNYRKRDPAAWYWVWDAVPVPAGDYTLVVRQTEHGHSEVNLGTVALKDGILNQLPMDQGVNISWPGGWTDRVYSILFTSNEGQTVKTDHSGPLFLAPGTYKVGLRLTEHNHKIASFGDITVPEQGFVDAKLTSGITFDTDLKARFKLFATNLDTGEKAEMSDSWGPMPLGAGRYHFELKLDGSKTQTIIPELEIKPGQFITANM